MITLRSIMTTDVTTVRPDSSLRDVVEILASEHISGVPVVDGGSVVGVVSSTDVLEFETDTPGVPVEHQSSMQRGTWPEPDLMTLDGDQPAAAFFTHYWDDAGADVTERFRETDGPEWDVLEEHTVDEIMTRSVFTLSAETDVTVAARQMLERGVHRILVSEGDRLVGLVSTTDMVRAVATHGVGSLPSRGAEDPAAAGARP